MSGDESPVRESQRELLKDQLLQALEKLGERRPRLLVFDTSLEEAFEQAGHDVTMVGGEGAWPRESSFDLIMATGLIERVSNDHQALFSAVQCLSEEAILVLAPPLALSGREPPEGALRHYSIHELASLMLRTGLMATSLWANGPELIIVECRRSTEVGARSIATIADLVNCSRWAEAEQALTVMTEQIEEEELVREFAMLVGHVHLGRGRLAEALEAFNNASNLAGPSPLPLTAMGAVALSANDFEAASELFTSALELCPTHFSALRGMGVVQESLDDLEAALTSFDMAATQRPFERELAEKVVELAITTGVASPAMHALERYSRATGNKKWARRYLKRITSLENHSSSSSSPPSLWSANR